jgi:ATP-dependent RNA helicase HelY
MDAHARSRVYLTAVNHTAAEIPPPKLISALRRFNLLPAIIFLPTRRKCDEAAQWVGSDRTQPMDKKKIEGRTQIFEEFLAEHPEIHDHKHAPMIVRNGVAAHHAGHIPAWKLLVEKMMSSGLLDAIFATSTVAAGVDFPARTVVITNADTRGNDGWRPLSVNELQQMTGRAGRRGRDNVGFVVLVPGQFQNPRKIAELLASKPDALESKFRATYISLLNLLDAFGSFDQVRQIAERSYSGYRNPQSTIRNQGLWEPFERRARVLDHFGYLNFEQEVVTDDGKWLADLRIDRPLIVGEALRDGIFDELQSREMAALMAAIASDAERSYGELRTTRAVNDLLGDLEQTIIAVSNVEWKYGVDPVEDINYSAAAAAERWTAGMEWDELVGRSKAEPGDLVRLLSRTGEALRQVAHASRTNTAVAAIARATSEAILRDPIR